MYLPFFLLPSSITRIKRDNTRRFGGSVIGVIIFLGVKDKNLTDNSAVKQKKFIVLVKLNFVYVPNKHAEKSIM